MTKKCKTSVVKILFLNEYIYPNVVSGAEFSMQLLAESLTKNDQEVIFFGPNLSKKRVDFYKKIKIIRFPFFKKISPYHVLSPIWFNNPIFWFYSAIFLIFTCLKEKIDLIQVHGKYLLPAAIISKLFLKIPVIATARDYNFLCPLALCLVKEQKICNFNYFINQEIKFYLSKYVAEEKLINRLFLIIRILLAKIFQLILFWFLKLADKIICISQAVLEIYKKNGIPKEKLIKIYNLSPEKLIKAKINNKKEQVVLYVGKISFGKGTDLLIKAVERVRKKLPNTKLILVGKKSSSLDEFPKFVNWQKQIPHEEVDKFYQKASLFCSPSRWPEPLGRSNLEALSAGLPLVLSNRGAHPELVVDGTNGFLVNEKVEEIASKILMILRNKKRAARMGQASLKILKERFNRRRIIEEHLNLYRKFLSKDLVFSDKSF